MGRSNIINPKSFTLNDVKNKGLVIQMLNYEEQITKSDNGQGLYKNTLNMPLISLNIEKILNRQTLMHFGFDTTDASVEMYRTIFKNYYNSPTDYDKEVLNSVHYMRENKCVYYQSPIINVGDIIPNCEIYELDGKTETSLYDVINKNKANYTLIESFSLS